MFFIHYLFPISPGIAKASIWCKFSQNLMNSSYFFGYLDLKLNSGCCVWCVCHLILLQFKENKHFNDINSRSKNFLLKTVDITLASINMYHSFEDKSECMAVQEFKKNWPSLLSATWIEIFRTDKRNVPG